jgi:hypothetical protein
MREKRQRRRCEQFDQPEQRRLELDERRERGQKR